MNLGRSLTRYGVGKSIRGAGGSPSLAKALSLIFVPWGKRR